MANPTLGPDLNLAPEKSVWVRFPKIELHRHLEGTFNLDTLFKIAKKNGVAVPTAFDRFKNDVQFPKDSKPDFLLFLSKFRNDWYRSIDDIRAITFDSVKQLKDDGIFFIELRFNPEHFAAFNNFDRATVTRTVIEAGNQAAEDTGITIRYLITLNRGKLDEADMIGLYRKILDLKNPWIVGIDLAGDEVNYGAELFTKLFSLIRSDGIYPSTIHAGEVTPASTIWSAIKDLNAARIGHGTAAINDPQLQDYLREHNIVLEQCLTSNHQTGAWPDEASHPMARLFRAGVPITINSDDPTIQDTDLTDDYVKASRYFGFSLNDFVRLNLNALNAAFLPASERGRLIANYMAAVERFKLGVSSQPKNA